MAGLVHHLALRQRQNHVTAPPDREWVLEWIKPLPMGLIRQGVTSWPGAHQGMSASEPSLEGTGFNAFAPKLRKKNASVLNAKSRWEQFQCSELQ